MVSHCQGCFAFCSHPVKHVGGMFSASASRAHHPSSKYAASLCHTINQFVTHCSQTPFKCSVSWKSQSSCWQHGSGSHLLKTVPFIFATAESGKFLLKELQQITSKMLATKKPCLTLFFCVQDSFLSFLRFYMDLVSTHWSTKQYCK